MQRDGHHGIERLVDRNRALEKPGQRFRQGLHAVVFEKVDQPAEGAFIESEAGCAVEASQALPARGADAVVVQRIAVNERSVAGDTEEFGFEGPGGFEAVGADRHASPSGERALADAAFVGEQQRKNAVGDRSESGSCRSR